MLSSLAFPISPRAIEPEQEVKRHIGVPGLEDRCCRMGRQPAAQDGGIVGKVDLVQDEQVGRGKLAGDGVADATVCSARPHQGGIDHDDHAVAGEPGLQRGDIGDAAGVRRPRRRPRPRYGRSVPAAPSNASNVVTSELPIVQHRQPLASGIVSPP